LDADRGEDKSKKKPLAGQRAEGKRKGGGSKRHEKIELSENVIREPRAVSERGEKLNQKKKEKNSSSQGEAHLSGTRPEN